MRIGICSYNLFTMPPSNIHPQPEFIKYIILFCQQISQEGTKVNARVATILNHAICLGLFCGALTLGFVFFGCSHKVYVSQTAHQNQEKSEKTEKYFIDTCFSDCVCRSHFWFRNHDSGWDSIPKLASRSAIHPHGHRLQIPCKQPDAPLHAEQYR